MLISLGQRVARFLHFFQRTGAKRGREAGKGPENSSPAIGAEGDGEDKGKQEERLIYEKILI